MSGLTEALKPIPAQILRPTLQVEASWRQRLQDITDGTGAFDKEVPLAVLHALEQHIIQTSHLTPDNVVTARTLLREHAFLGRERNDPNREGYEIFLDAGCLHGASPDKLVEYIQANHPDRVFISDLVGSTFSEKTKKIYYNDMMNKIRNNLLPLDHPEYKQDDDLHIQEFLYTNLGTPEAPRTAKEGFLNLTNYVLDINPNDSAAQQMKIWNDEQITLWMWFFSHPNQFHGQWMSGLDKETRNYIFDEVEREVDLQIQNIEANKGDTETHYFEGNWDNWRTIKNVSDGNAVVRDLIHRITAGTITKQDVIALSEIKQENIHPSDPLGKGFDYKGILEKNGNRLIDDLEAIETDNCLHIIGPYFALIELKPDEPRYQSVVAQAAEARRNGKLVVMHMHGVANKEYLFQKKKEVAVGDNKLIADHIHALMVDTGAELLIHQHEHDPKTDADGHRLPANMHLVYDRVARPGQRGSMEIVTDPTKIGVGDQLVNVYSQKEPAFAVTVIGSERNRNLIAGTSLPSHVLYGVE